MRRTNEPKWVLGEDGGLLGLAMGSDFCSEHEWGTARLRESFGLPGDEVDGLERRRVRLIPEQFFFVEAKTHTVLGFNPEVYNDTPAGYFAREVKTGSLHPPGKWLGERPELACAWDEKRFGAAAWGTKKGPDRSRLRSLYDAFRRLDVAFWANVGPFHLGTGLTFVIASKVPKQHSDAMLEADLDRKRLLTAASETGIERELQEAGLRWYALSPKWSKELKSVIRDGGTEVVETQYPVMFWLNPMEQQKHNHGWFTVEQLREWVSGRGPVPKGAGKR